MRPSTTFQQGAVVGDRYRIERAVARGGMGAVYVATHIATYRRVALKVIDAALAADERVRAMFEGEGKALGQIETQHVVQVLDAGIDANTSIPFIVTELLGGETFAHYLRKGPISPRLAVSVAAHVCIGLKKAHELGIVHRDVKPNNIILVPSEAGDVIAKLIDFGVALFAARDVEPEGTIIGSPLYMSPEQMRGSGVDYRSDLYSLGMVLYTSLAGRTPRGASLNITEIVINAVTQDVPPLRDSAPWVPPEVASIVDRALRRPQNERFQDADEMLQALAAVLPQGWRVTPAMLDPDAVVHRHVAKPPPINVFVSYVSGDAGFRDELAKHLALLQREELINHWDAQRIGAGQDWRNEAARALDSSRLILLLVSADYLASDYQYESEMRRALERHSQGLACVIPIIVRHCDWRAASFNALATLPADGRPVAAWPDRDQAWTHIVDRVRESLVRLTNPIGVGLPTLVLPTQVMRREADPSTIAPRDARRGAAYTMAQPDYPNESTRILSQRIEVARARCRALEAAGADPSEALQEVLALRRELREDGQLKAGDSLGDGRFLLVRRIGRGGFATVWESLDRVRSERVAIKVLHSNLAGDAVRLERFFRGPRIMAALKHPGVVDILEQRGTEAGWNYFVMEFVAGGDLRCAVLGGYVAKRDLLPIILRVGTAVAAAHERGIIHRDVKPANILLDGLDSPKLADFDLVGAADTTGGTRTGALGTFIYAAPELLDRPQDADARADVFGLGMTAVFSLYGAELPAAMMKRTDDFLRSLDCTRHVRQVLARAIDWDRDTRFPDAGAFCGALREAVGSELEGGG